MFLFLAIFTTTVSAQFNSKVGYSAMYLNMDKVEDIFQAYSAANQENLAEELSAFTFTHGLELGARYRVGNLSFEFGLISGQGETKATANDGTELRYKASMFDYHFNLVQHIKNFGFGAGVTNQKVRLRKYNAITSKFDNITEEKQWGARVFVQIEVPSRIVSFAIRPYYQFSFDSYATDALANDLSVAQVGNQDLHIYGLSVLFFNGRQAGW